MTLKISNIISAKTKVVHGLWLDRAGYWAVKIENESQVFELHFEGTDFIWNRDGTARISILSNATNEKISISKPDLIGLNALLKKIQAASAKDLYAKFQQSFV